MALFFGKTPEPFSTSRNFKNGVAIGCNQGFVISYWISGAAVSGNWHSPNNLTESIDLDCLTGIGKLCHQNISVGKRVDGKRDVDFGLPYNISFHVDFDDPVIFQFRDQNISVGKFFCGTWRLGLVIPNFLAVQIELNYFVVCVSIGQKCVAGEVASLCYLSF